ncbi:hypothetical protein [Amycolatopsis azurea]|uniref:Secreted protein n=1 Tax=Amycolatopsis azurea DSM 43854 TaxID=1238180 RepID=M2QTJ4_9PSEU|nr:hypothetical protein [Amycolatopsis azurea]EMD29826.1 hypothetical protein C791_3186 [Amycolatopsis azurea DSM 43854]OOC07371.1 hypothetical protein B0293_06745 [Amycolatopsis azurea DSM 43854]
MRRLLAAAAAALSAAALVTLPGSASAASSPAPEFDFSACPAPPADADPGTWRCEAFVSQGVLTLGDRTIPLGELRLTFSEGKVDGKFAQVFGELRHAPARIPNGFGASLQLKYGNYSDFLSNDERRGELDLYAVLRHPLLPKECSIGTLDAPLHSVVKDDPAVPMEVISQNPKTVKFGVVDTRLALPRATGCGPLSPVADHLLGLPSASGANTFKLATYVRFKPL